jgi:hypothetical protein
MIKYKVLSWHMSSGTEENYKQLHLDGQCPVETRTEHLLFTCLKHQSLSQLSLSGYKCLHFQPMAIRSHLAQSQIFIPSMTLFPSSLPVYNLTLFKLCLLVSVRRRHYIPAKLGYLVFQNLHSTTQARNGSCELMYRNSFHIFNGA